MSHYINCCRHGYVVSQCRCPGGERTYDEPCPDTKAHHDYVLAKQDADHRNQVLAERIEDKLRYWKSNIKWHRDVNGVELNDRNQGQLDLIDDLLLLFFRG